MYNEKNTHLVTDSVIWSVIKYGFYGCFWRKKAIDRTLALPINLDK